MSCVVALVDNGEIYMGADSFCADGTTFYPVADQKIFTKKGFLIGCSGKFRVIHLIHHTLILPDFQSGQSLEQYLNTNFVDAVRDCLRKAGSLKNESGIETTDAVMLVGHEGRLFVVDEDFNVSEISSDFFSIGNGQDAALGALYALKRNTSLSPLACIQQALEAAEKFTINVRSPFIVLKMDREGEIARFPTIYSSTGPSAG